MAYTAPQTITLDGSGEATVTLDDFFAGMLLTIFVDKDGQTNNPTVTFTEVGGGGRQLLSATESGSGYTAYPVREQIQDNTGTDTGLYNPFEVETPVQLAVTGGDNAGTVTVLFQYLPANG